MPDQVAAYLQAAEIPRPRCRAVVCTGIAHTLSNQEIGLLLEYFEPHQPMTAPAQILRRVLRKRANMAGISDRKVVKNYHRYLLVDAGNLEPLTVSHQDDEETVVEADDVESLISYAIHRAYDGATRELFSELKSGRLKVVREEIRMLELNLDEIAELERVKAEHCDGDDDEGLG
jgi:hypothetical protein